MMYKIDINPVTGRLRSYTKVQENTPIYNDDMIVDESEIADITAISAAALSAESVEDYDAAVQALAEEIQKLTAEDEKDYLVRLVVDQGKDLAEAREAIQQRRKQAEALNEQLNSMLAEHETAIRNYWLAKDAAADMELTFKHYSTVVLLIKDENRYLKEWIDWHRNLGFDHIYIYDNGVKEHVSEVVSDYPAEIQNMITVIDWSGHHEHIQQDAYNHFLGNYRTEVRWGLFIDSDEFVRFTDGKTTDVNTFLKSYEDYTEIWGYENEYNANGQEAYEDKPVRERFTQTTDVRDGYFWKNFVQVNRISHFTMHYAQYNAQKHFLFKNEENNKDLFVIDHYYTKSWEEWNIKIKERGGADPNYHKALQEFFLYNPDMEYLNTGENAVQAYE